MTPSVPSSPAEKWMWFLFILLRPVFWMSFQALKLVPCTTLGASSGSVISSRSTSTVLMEWPWLALINSSPLSPSFRAYLCLLQVSTTWSMWVSYDTVDTDKLSPPSHPQQWSPGIFCVWEHPSLANILPPSSWILTNQRLILLCINQSKVSIYPQTQHCVWEARREIWTVSLMRILCHHSSSHWCVTLSR